MTPVSECAGARRLLMKCVSLAVLRETDTVFALIREVKEHTVDALRRKNGAAKQAAKNKKQKAAAAAFASMMRALSAQEGDGIHSGVTSTTMSHPLDGVASVSAATSYFTPAVDSAGVALLTPWLADFGELQHESRMEGGPAIQSYLITAEHLQQMWSKPFQVLGELGWTDIFPPHQFGVDVDLGVAASDGDAHGSATGTAQAVLTYPLHVCTLTCCCFHRQPHTGAPIYFPPPRQPGGPGVDHSVVPGVPCSAVFAYLLRKLQELLHGSFCSVFHRVNHASQHMPGQQTA